MGSYTLQPLRKALYWVLEYYIFFSTCSWFWFPILATYTEKCMLLFSKVHSKVEFIGFIMGISGLITHSGSSPEVIVERHAMPDELRTLCASGRGLRV